MSKRDWESDTASEEDEPNEDLSIETKLAEERSNEKAMNLERFGLRNFLVVGLIMYQCARATSKGVGR